MWTRGWIFPFAKRIPGYTAGPRGNSLIIFTKVSSRRCNIVGEWEIIDYLVKMKFAWRLKRLWWSRRKDSFFRLKPDIAFYCIEPLSDRGKDASAERDREKIITKPMILFLLRFADDKNSIKVILFFAFDVLFANRPLTRFILIVSVLRRSLNEKLRCRMIENNDHRCCWRHRTFE